MKKQVSFFSVSLFITIIQMSVGCCSVANLIFEGLAWHVLHMRSVV